MRTTVNLRCFLPFLWFFEVLGAEAGRAAPPSRQQGPEPARSKDLKDSEQDLEDFNRNLKNLGGI